MRLRINGQELRQPSQTVASTWRTVGDPKDVRKAKKMVLDLLDAPGRKRLALDLKFWKSCFGLYYGFGSCSEEQIQCKGEQFLALNCLFLSLRSCRVLPNSLGNGLGEAGIWQWFGFPRRVWKSHLSCLKFFGSLCGFTWKTIPSCWFLVAMLALRRGSKKPWRGPGEWSAMEQTWAENYGTIQNEDKTVPWLQRQFWGGTTVNDIKWPWENSEKNRWILTGALQHQVKVDLSAQQPSQNSWLLRMAMMPSASRSRPSLWSPLVPWRCFVPQC